MDGNTKDLQIKPNTSKLCKRIRIAKKELPADLVLKNCRVVNVFSNEILEQEIAISDDSLAATGKDYQGKQEIDLQGALVLPGLIDAHIHIESTMLSPRNLARALLCCGTTTIIADPHEIANVLGMQGIGFMLEQSQGIPLDIFFMAPSCVPATHLETSGARIDMDDLRELRHEDKIIGLAEMMNYPGVLNCQDEVLEKILLFSENIVDGHCPGLMSNELQAYISAGIGSDHEATGLEEARQKLRSGMMVMIREGTTAKNMEALLPLVSPENSHRFSLVSDDLNPIDIQERGHLNYLLKRAVKLGLDPLLAVRLLTLNPASYFGLRDRGAVAPGYKADLLVVSDFDSFNVEMVLKNGQIVVKDGRLLPGLFETGEIKDVSVLGSMNMLPFDPEELQIPAEGSRARVIELVPGQIITKSIALPIHAEDGMVVSDPGNDILKLVVIERHKASGRIGLGLVKGFGLTRGAIASSVAHDSHNVIVTGVEDGDIFLAIQEIGRMGGGMVVVENASVKAAAPLQIAGLMSTLPLEELTPQLRKVYKEAKNLGSLLADPFMYLSFLALPVIPELKLTDMGLVDVKRFEIVPLFL